MYCAYANNVKRVQKVRCDMPRGDGTGPSGQGPRTGRGLGTCIGTGIRRLFGESRGVRQSSAFSETGEMGTGTGRGMGRGQRAGRRGRGGGRK